MTKSFTPNDLVSYIYQELSETESDQLTQALHANEALMEQYIELRSAIDQLDQVFMEPSEKVVDAIKRKCLTKENV
ncbi:hypothetical protein KIH41_14210 [Litoribacter ruber]|uniref:Uncharacterized protein n=1 Tax=Litoribacter ruber TaxID=702568 RepID=A0AAP2CKF5_9BACT|nr:MULTISPECIES: hypothetical protein [Litoribacter]MBS9523437.1 hypothetical protein [Litoribacter alkaliphilus]MBT0812437.1 hypothetical protein [Litoribacter ruber]